MEYFISSSSSDFFIKLFYHNKSSTFLSGYCTPQEGYIEPFIPAASCGVFWKVLDKKEKVGTPEGITTLPTLPVYSIYGCFGLRITGTCGPVSGSPIRSRYFFIRSS